MRKVLAAALFAACHPAKPAPPPAPIAVPIAPADAGVAADPARIAWERRDADPAALDQAIALFEDEALRTAGPAGKLLGAARARRERMRRTERRTDLDPADTARSQAEDAQACAADARRSWAAQFPAAAAEADRRPPPELFTQIGPAGADALYLDAVCSAAWARLQGFTPLIERRVELLAALLRVAQIAPDLDGAGPDRELGALLAALPPYAGGDLSEARKHLEDAVRRAPADFRNRVVLARTVAVKSQDRGLFEEQLRAVLKGDDAASVAEATALLQREDDLFGDAGH